MYNIYFYQTAYMAIRCVLEFLQGLIIGTENQSNIHRCKRVDGTYKKSNTE